MKIIDTHAHLDQLENLDQAMQNAVEAGVDGIVLVSMNLASCRKNLEIKKRVKQPKIYLAMGTHPAEVNLGELGECLKFIRSQREHLIAVGEIGLDFWYKWVKKDLAKQQEQIQSFTKHLELAKELNLPAIIHSRGAWKECLDIVGKIGLKKALFHWYSGPVDILKNILDAGCYVSTSPSLAYSPQSREAMSVAPIERILIETDSPVHFKTDSGGGGFTAEPKDVVRTLKAYCALKNVDEQKALDIFNQNAKQFFNLN